MAQKKGPKTRKSIAAEKAEMGDHVRTLLIATTIFSKATANVFLIPTHIWVHARFAGGRI